MYQVVKRDGKVVDFNLQKISDAIKMAFDAQERQYVQSIIDFLALKVTAEFESKIKDDKISVEDIQDTVESVLIQAGYDDVAKAYILYRRQREKLRSVKTTMLDYKDLVDSYVKVSDWRVKENSTVTYSVGGLILSNSGAITANYWLSEVYDEEIANAHRNGDLHIHDLSMLTGYCAGWSLRQLIEEGLGGVPGKISSSPASHLSTLCNQMVNFLGIMQNEWAGAQAFSSFDTYLAPFVKKDNLTYKEVKQCIQSFVYGVNTPSRWGTQAPFTNITLDWTVPADLKDRKAIVGGKEQDFTYGDCKKEMDMVNKAFIEIMLEGDCNGRGFQYPIPTYSITKDFDWSETENNKLLFEMTAKYGTPYFSNYINSDMEPSDVRSMCCRLRLDLRELRKKSGGFFGSGESTGSVGVVTIDLPRIAYLSKDPEEFYKRLDHLMDIAAKSLDIKRKVITQLLEAGLYPYTKRYLGTFANHFSTIGLIGMNEVGLNAKWLGGDMTTKKTQEFAKDVLNHMRERLSDYQEQYGDLFNLEATPAESTTYRLAKHDKERYPEIKTAAECNGTPFYTNSSHLPVGYTEDIFSALDVQDELQTLYTSGTVFHAFLGEKLPDWKAAANLVRKIAENYKLPYYTMSPTYSICKNHGYIAGEVYECPKCKEKTEVYSRITGYYRPVQNWNDGKLQEFKQRKEYVVLNKEEPKVVKEAEPVKKEENTVTEIKQEVKEQVKETVILEPVIEEKPVVKSLEEDDAFARFEDFLKNLHKEPETSAEEKVAEEAEEIQVEEVKEVVEETTEKLEEEVNETPIEELKEEVKETPAEEVKEEVVEAAETKQEAEAEEVKAESKEAPQENAEESFDEKFEKGFDAVFTEPAGNYEDLSQKEPELSAASELEMELQKEFEAFEKQMAEAVEKKKQEELAKKKAEEEAELARKQQEEQRKASEKKFLLFATKTCPNCKIIKEYLAEQNIDYQLIIAEENKELSRNLGIMQAPTAVIIENGETKKYVGVQSIKAYIQSL